MKEDISEEREKFKFSQEKLLYSSKLHSKELLKEICKNHKSDGYNKFEEISIFLKCKNLKKAYQFKKKEKENKPIVNITDYEKKIFLEQKLKTQNKELLQTNVYIDDIITNSQLLEWAGISFSKVEWYKLNLSIKKLISETKAISLKFFGKIFGRNNDYYILYGDSPKHKDLKFTKGKYENKGIEGINRFSIWVSNNTLDDWIELPIITPEQMISSRLFKYSFTGDLYSQVSSFNYFPGLEIHLLKCQIVRILHGAYISPAGLLRSKGEVTDPELEGKLVEVDPDFKTPTEEMNLPEKWVHEHANILLSGRIIHETIANEEEMAKLLENDKYIERLKSIAEDEQIIFPKAGLDPLDEASKIPENQKEPKPSWNFRIVGDNQIYSNLPPKDGNANYSCVVIRSLRWPGTTFVFKNGEYVGIYVGNGIKFGGNLVHPTDPNYIYPDPEDLREQPEPNPDKEPEVIESDTDKEDEEEKDN